MTLVTVVLVTAMAVVSAPAAMAADTWGVEHITVDDDNTTLHYYDAQTPQQAWAWGDNNDDTWELTVATSCEALVRITWFDYYPTDDIYELFVDGSSHGLNLAGRTGEANVWLSVGEHTIVVDWLFYQDDRPPIPGGSWYDIKFEVLDQDCVTEVEIDIKPGSDPNCFNNDGRGAIPVAILSSVDFDATTVDPLTVDLDGQTVRRVGKGKLQAHVEDVNGDGLLDLMLQFEDVDGTYAADSGTGTLTGETLDGAAIEGQDSICVVSA
jgi:hypothetical protein